MGDRRTPWVGRPARIHVAPVDDGRPLGPSRHVENAGGRVALAAGESSRWESAARRGSLSRMRRPSAPPRGPGAGDSPSGQAIRHLDRLSIGIEEGPVERTGAEEKLLSAIRDTQVGFLTSVSLSAALNRACNAMPTSVAIRIAGYSWPMSASAVVSDRAMRWTGYASP